MPKEYEETMVELEGRRYTVSQELVKLHTTVQVLKNSEGALKTRLAESESRSDSYRRQLENMSKELVALRNAGGGGSGTGDSSKSFSLLSSIPDFEGNAKEDVKAFGFKVEQAAKFGRWSPEETLLAVRQKLVGTALQVVQSETKLRSVTEFKELREFLIQRFKKKNTQRFYREQLGRIKKMGKSRWKSMRIGLKL
jgi:phage shock protein A